jgi:hypothetical protein
MPMTYDAANDSLPPVAVKAMLLTHCWVHLAISRQNFHIESSSNHRIMSDIGTF